MAIIKIVGNYYYFFQSTDCCSSNFNHDFNPERSQRNEKQSIQNSTLSKSIVGKLWTQSSSWICSQHLCLVSPPQFSTLYIISFVVITLGFVMFNAVPTYSALPDSGEDDPAEASGERTAESSSDHLLSADRETAVISLWLKLTEERTSLLSERFYCNTSTHFLVLGKFLLF